MNTGISQVAKISIRSSLLQEGLFWMLSYYILYRLFRFSEETTRTDLIYTVLFHVALLAIFYTNTRLLIPWFFRKETYGLYALLSLLLIGVGALLNQLLFRYLTNLIFPGYYFISYYRFVELLQFSGAYWAISTLLTLSRSWFVVREQAQHIQQLQQERTVAELRALKAQLDPHFLFNSLNNIYALALYRDQRTPEALLKLSDSMRYVLHDCQAQRVSLAREMQHLRDYLALYAMGIDHPVDLQVQIDLEDPDDPEAYQIAPLLLLPLVENAGKHSRPDPSGRHFIHLKLRDNGQQLLVCCRNSCRPESPDNASGIGLRNLQERLRLLYPQQHQLQLHPGDHQFTAKLAIPFTLNPQL